MTHKGWYSRGYLPHFDQPHLLQSITFRLHDSLPTHVVEELSKEAKWRQNVEKRRKIEALLDAGSGACYLKDARIAKIVEDALHFFDGKRYYLLAWCIMPNHVHVLIQQIEGYLLGDIVGSWKSFTANEANLLLKRRGDFWYLDFFDRYIRNARHFETVVNYIHFNPVSAGLVDEAEKWRFSSARLWQDGGVLPPEFF